MVLGDATGPRVRSALRFVACAPQWEDQRGVQAAIQRRMRGVRLELPRRATYNLYVRATGTVGRVVVEHSSGRPDLDGIALPELTRARFRPAIIEGIPVPVWVEFSMSFGPGGA